MVSGWGRNTGVRTVMHIDTRDIPRPTEEFRRRAWQRFQAALDRYLAGKR